jgi:hypothetical protein
MVLLDIIGMEFLILSFFTLSVCPIRPLFWLDAFNSTELRTSAVPRVKNTPHQLQAFIQQIG